jgi:hypothetical protein
MKFNEEELLEEHDEIFKLITDAISDYYKDRPKADATNVLYVLGWLFIKGMTLYSENRSDLKNKVNSIINEILDSSSSSE